MSKAPTPLPLWRSGFCPTDDALPWQHDACHGGHARTPTKADPRTWVPCCCSCHQPAPAEEEPVPAPTTPAPPPELDNLTLEQAINLFTAAADRLSETTTKALMGTSWQDTIRLLSRLRAAGRTAGQVDAVLVKHIYLTGEHGDQVVDGVGRVGIGRSRERTHWDERGVARAVIDAHMADTTGEAPDPWAVAEWLLEVYGVNYVRVTPLRGLGLEPKAFCDETPGKPTVQLPPVH